MVNSTLTLSPWGSPRLVDTLIAGSLILRRGCSHVRKVEAPVEEEELCACVSS
jgi:hypothetical protein